MTILPLADRLASAHAVVNGRHGDVSRLARQRGSSRQALYRQARAVTRALDTPPNSRRRTQLRRLVGRLLEGLDEASRARVRQAAADEIFVGRKPVLMVLEPESLCWQVGRLSERRDGDAWAAEFRRLPALEQATRDSGSGLAKGLRQV